MGNEFRCYKLHLDENLSFLLFFRCPDSSGIKKKMIYASSKDAVAKKLEGIQVNIQCNDLDEISYAEVIEQASKGKAKF